MNGSSREVPAAYNRPLPQLNDWNRPFFEAGLNQEFKLQHCMRCGRFIYYPRPMCTECGSTELEWKNVSGRGTLYSYTKVWRPEHPYFHSQVPIIIGMVQLEEGPTMFARILGDDGELEIGMALNVDFEIVAHGIALPVFRPAED
jgi:uncharacterized protein